jgi:hypothetical protein|tara:strand:+ start:134 stop:607 length:474 start_codon:yes stop_codon:yes gene_type:complete
MHNKAEREFSLKLKDFVPATREQNMFEHWDMKGTLFDVTNKIFKFDVKGIKRDTRHGNLNPKIVWTESQNVRGNKGWLYGKADFISFEKPEQFVIVDRIKLLEFMREKIAENNNEIVEQPHAALYRIYQRQGRKDKISKALMSDMEFISEWIVNKHA